MRPEIAGTIYSIEQKKPGVIPAVTLIGAQPFRNEMTGIAGTVISPDSPLKTAPMFGKTFVEIPLQQPKPEISPIDEVKKTESYHPGRRKGTLIDENGRRILRRRPRRPSRCNGTHDKESDPCGSPRCRSTNRGNKNTANTSRNIRGRSSLRTRRTLQKRAS